MLGMLPALCRGNVLKLEGSEIICINPPGMETFASWGGETEPDENIVIAHEDLLELDNVVLLESIGEASHDHRRALTGLAARASLAEVDDYEDEDSPAQCSLFAKRQCKYQDGAFKPPRHTMWIGCSYPSCNRWYHEQCLSLLFKTEESRRTYTLICPEHTNHREHFQNKIVALASDPHSLESENISLQPLSKRMRTQRTGTNAEHCTDYSIRPNYVDYEGQYFHMAEFLSLQEGKVYRPGMS